MCFILTFFTKTEKIKILLNSLKSVAKQRTTNFKNVYVRYKYNSLGIVIQYLNLLIRKLI